MKEQYLTTEEAAELAGVNRQTIINWVNERLIGGKKIRCAKGYRFIIDKQSLQNLIEDCTIKADTEAIARHKELLIKEKESLLQERQAVKDEWEALKQTKDAICTYPNVLETVLRILDVVEVNYREREAEILRRVLRGVSFDRIAQDYGLRSERIRQIVQYSLRKMGNAPSYLQQGEAISDLKKQIGQLQVEKDVLGEQIKILWNENAELAEKVGIENVFNPEELDKETAALMSSRLIDHNLSVRTLKALRRYNIETIGDLIQYSSQYLLKIKYIGKKSLRELDDLLNTHGLKFKTVSLDAD